MTSTVHTDAPPDRSASDLLDITEDAYERVRPLGPDRAWTVLVVDDDPDVHAATRFALARTTIFERPLDLVSAYSAAEGRAVLEQNPDVGVVLLDVVM
jgi:hypothetical protein